MDSKSRWIQNLGIRFDLDLPVQPHVQKYFRFHPTQIISLFRAIPSRESNCGGLDL
jgi:hypothetical protein